jgi:hypothetical protein
MDPKFLVEAMQQHMGKGDMNAAGIQSMMDMIGAVQKDPQLAK